MSPVSDRVKNHGTKAAFNPLIRLEAPRADALRTAIASRCKPHESVISTDSKAESQPNKFK